MTTELHLLGGFRAESEGRTITELRGATATKLLAYLALHRQNRPRRMYLASLFWPDGSETRARRRLSHTLWELQTALADVDPTLVQADRDTVGLNQSADVWIDAEVFERQVDAFELKRREGKGHLHAEGLARAVELYTGDLLADYYEDWIEPYRLRLREKFLLGVRHLVQLQKGQGEYSAALVNARRLVAETPLAETAHLELMRLYWLAGRPEEALAQFVMCSEILDRELGVTPGAELEALNARIRGQREPGSASTPRVSEIVEDETLIGRAEERSRLLDVVDAAFAGKGGFALIDGQAGMGKTRLLTDIAEAARWRGSTVVWSRRSDQHREPYAAITAPLGQVLRGLRREQVLARLDAEFLPLAARLIPGLDDTGADMARPTDWASPDERWQYQEALTQVLLTLGAVEPVTLIVDDLQMADTETLEFIRLAAPRLAETQIAVLLAYRTHEARNRPEVWGLLTDLEQRHRVSRIHLGGLPADAIAALARARSHGPLADAVVNRLDAATGGNPLFIVETIRAIDRSDSGAVDGAGQEVIDAQFGGRATVERVLQVLIQEIDVAPAGVQHLVGALAIWGRPASSSTLARLIESDKPDTLATIRAGVDAEFVQEVDGSYDLRFEQLATAAAARLPAETHRRLHLRAAELMAEDPLAPAAALANHYREAECWPETARFEAAAAARAAGLHSYDTAAEYYQRALESHELGGQAPSVGLLLGLEQVLDILGRRDDQARVLEQLEAVEDASTANQARVLRRSAMFAANTDNMLDAVRRATSAITYAFITRQDVTPARVTLSKVLVLAGYADLARRHLDGILDDGERGAELGQAHLALGLALIDVQDFDASSGHLATALQLFRDQGDRRGEVEALAAVAVLHSHTGDTATALRSYNDAIVLARQIGNRFGEAMALANLGLLNYIQGDAAAALGHLQDAIDVFMAIGHRRGEATVRANRAAILHTVTGDDAAAEREATFARRYFEEIGDRRHEAQCLDVLAGIRRRRRAFAVSRRLLETSLAMVSSTNDRWLEVQMLRSLAWTETEAGRHGEAAVALATAIGLAEEADLGLELPFLLALEGRNLLACGKVDEAQAAVERSRMLISQGAGMEHVAALWRSEVFEAAGDTVTAEDELQTAHKHLLELLEPFDDSEREAATNRVVEHRAIRDAYASRFPRTELVLLPPKSDPSLDPCIEVRWTVHHPDDLYVKDKKERRRQRLWRILDEAEVAGTRPRLEDLAAALTTSLSTIKRDIATLRDRGLSY